MESVTPKTEINKRLIDINSLTKIAIYLSGLRDGKGDLLPLGVYDLEELWNAIGYLRGEERCKAPRDV